MEEGFVDTGFIGDVLHACAGQAFGKENFPRGIPNKLFRIFV
jgi:hypothetical protein